MRLTLALFLTSLVFFSSGQSREIDSLTTLLKTDAEDTTKVIHLNRLSKSHTLITEYEKALQYGQLALTLSQKLDYKKGIGNAYNNIGFNYYSQSNYSEALKNHFAALKIREEIKDKRGIAFSHSSIGVIYQNQGNYPEALKNYYASLKIYEETKNKPGMANAYNNVGVINNYLNNYSEALKNYYASYKLHVENNNKHGIADYYTNVGNIYYRQDNYPEALKNFVASLKIYEEMKDKFGIANAHNNVGAINECQNDFEEALKNYFSSLKLREEVGDMDGSVTSLLNIGRLYTKLNKTKDAGNYLNKALKLGLKIGYKEDIKEIYIGLTVLDSTMGNFKDAFAHHKLYVIYRDSLNNEETQKKNLQSTMQYEFDKKEIAAKAEQEKLDAISKEEKQKQQLITYGIAAGLILVLVFSLFLFNRFRITQKQKKVIEEQKVLVDKAYETLHEKNQEVLDSINYASRIQKALITSESYITKQLNKLTKNN